MAHRPAGGGYVGASIASTHLVLKKNLPIKDLRSLIGYCSYKQSMSSLIIHSKYPIYPPRILETKRFQSDKVPGDKHSSTTSEQTGATDSSTSNKNSNPENNEIILTPGEKVVVGTRLTLWAGALVFAGACAYYIGRELFPSKMSPNSVFNSSFEIVRNHTDVTKRFGSPLKAYGRDHGGHREGRRNFVEYVLVSFKDILSLFPMKETHIYSYELTIF